MLIVGVVVIAGIASVVHVATAGAAPEPSRQHITITKLCPPKDFDPEFIVENTTNDPDVTDPQATPETISFIITKGKESGAPTLFTGTLAPGAQMDVTLTGQPWHGTYFAQFDAMYKGKLTHFDSKQFCACENEEETSTSTSSSTSTSTSTSSSTSTSTSTSTTSTSTSTTTTSTSTTSTSMPTTTTSTTIRFSRRSTTTTSLSPESVSKLTTSTTAPGANPEGSTLPPGSTGGGGGTPTGTQSTLPFTGGGSGTVPIAVISLLAGVALVLGTYRRRDVSGSRATSRSRQG